MSSSPFAAVGGMESANIVRQERDGSFNDKQHSTPSSLTGASSTKSPFNTAKGMTSTNSSGFSPGTLQQNMPSPATFATMAAAVGVQNPLEDSNGRTQGGVDGKTQDPYAELLSNAENFLNTQLSQLEAAGNRFFDLYECVSDEREDDRSTNKVVIAHQNLLSTFDQLLNTATRIGIAAIPCPISDQPSILKAANLDELHSRLMSETKETFERRERLREGTSMVTSILTHDQWQKFKPS